MAKSKKELAQPSTIVKDETLEILENGDDNDEEIEEEIIDSIQAVKSKKEIIGKTNGTRSHQFGKRPQKKGRK